MKILRSQYLSCVFQQEKIPHLAYTKWEEEKVKIKAEGEEISIEGFIKSYTNLINIEEKTQYIRKQSKPS